jgi:OmpR family response regulator RpaB
VVVYNPRILVVDKDINIRQALENMLTALGYKVFLASNGKEALLSFTNNQPDLVILDIVLPKLDGYEVCRKIRDNSQVPLIILTALNNTSNQVLGLELGADDYIIKPFSPTELEARIKSVLRRVNLTLQKPKKSEHTNFQIGNLTINLDKKAVSKNDLRIKLTATEYSVFELLIENSGKSISRKKILENVWGYTPERDIDARIVDVHISRLRAKIEETPGKPDFIVTVRGKGYMFPGHCF